MTRSVLWVVNTETSPLLPAGTMAALATAAFDGAFTVEATGCDCPAGQPVRKPRPAGCGSALATSTEGTRWLREPRIHGEDTKTTMAQNGHIQGVSRRIRWNVGAWANGNWKSAGGLSA